MKVTIASGLRRAAPELALGLISAEVDYRQRNDELWLLLQARGKELATALQGVDLGSVAAFAAARQVYRQLGKDPSRYRGSAEALFRRLLSKKELYQVNNIVDVNNLVSLETRHPVGSYDLASVRGDTIFRVGEAGETYQGIGKDVINLEGLPVFSDEQGPFGSPTSDSRRTMIGPQTSRIGMVIIAFAGPEHLDVALRDACAALETYAGARKLESHRSEP